jgi:hypothetical protein
MATGALWWRSDGAGLSSCPTGRRERFLPQIREILTDRGKNKWVFHVNNDVEDVLDIVPNVAYTPWAVEMLLLAVS